MPIQGSPAILALSSRPWLNYAYRGILQFTPLIFDALDYAWSFSAELCPEGLIGIVGNSLRCVPLSLPLLLRGRSRLTQTFAARSIFTFPRLGQKVQQTVIDLSYTPRQLLTSPYSRLLYTVEADHRTFGAPAAQKAIADLRAAEIEVDDEALELDPREFGLPRAPAGTWGSCLRVIDPVTVRPLSLSLSSCCSLEGALADSARRCRPTRSSSSTSTTTRRPSLPRSSRSTRSRPTSSSSSARART